MAQDIQLIALHRQGGKTTALLEELFERLQSVREGTSRPGSAVVVTHDFREQERVLELIFHGMEERGIPFTKSLANTYVASQHSLDRLKGTKPRYIYIDNADLFEEGLYQRELQPLMETTEFVISTYTPRNRQGHPITPWEVGLTWNSL